jgi:copper(I)-binding protein
VNPLSWRGAGVAAVLVTTAILTGGCGGDDGAVSVKDARSRPTAPSVSVGAVYMTLEASSDDALLGASVAPDIAARVTLHRTGTANGTSTMHALDALDLPAGEQVAIEPGGTHLMLEQLAEPLVDGTSFRLTLDFAEAPDQLVAVEVSSGET